jgi:hypothetical protein
MPLRLLRREHLFMDMCALKNKLLLFLSLSLNLNLNFLFKV